MTFKLHVLHGGLQNINLSCQLLTFPFTVSHAPTMKNTSSRINSLLATNSWDHLQSLLFASQSRGKSCSTTLLLNRHRFRSCVTEWATEFNTQLQTANRHKQFLGVADNQAPYYPVYFQMNHNVCTFFVPSTKLVIQNFYTIPYIVILQGTVDTGSFFQKLWHHFFHNTYFRVYHLHLILPNSLFHLGFPTKILSAFVFSYIHIYIHRHGCPYTDK